MSSLQLLFTSSFDGLRYFEQNEAYAVTMDTPLRKSSGIAKAASCDSPWQVYLIDLTWFQGYFSSSSPLEVSF